jgi:hypothetical protein
MCCDNAPPGLRLKSVRSGPPTQLIIEARNYEGGRISNISVITAVNAEVRIPTLYPTTSYVDVVATKIDERKMSQVALSVCIPCECEECDEDALCCEDGDPVEFTLPGGERWGSMKILTGIPEAEGRVTITNYTPGLSALTLVVNGKRFRLSGLRDGEELTIDVASAVQPGETNEFVLRADGPRGSRARILIWDGVGDPQTHPNLVRSGRAGQLGISP